MTQEIKRILTTTGILYFEEALQIKKTPHHPVTNLWACQLQGSTIWVMDSSEEWYEVEEKDTIVIASLFQRLTLIIKTLTIC